MIDSKNTYMQTVSKYKSSRIEGSRFENTCFAVDIRTVCAKCVTSIISVTPWYTPGAQYTLHTYHKMQTQTRRMVSAIHIHTKYISQGLRIRRVTKVHVGYDHVHKVVTQLEILCGVEYLTDTLVP